MATNYLRALYGTWVGWIIIYFIVLAILYLISAIDFHSSDFNRTFKGNIGSNVPVTLHLISDSGRLSGYYQYDKFGKPVAIIGRLNGDMVEFDGLYDGKNIDKFEGEINSNSLRGIWYGVERKKSESFIFYSTKEISMEDFIGSLIEKWLILGLIGCGVLVVLLYFKSGPFKVNSTKPRPYEPEINPQDSGLRFEGYVAELLPKNYYEFRDWRSDKSYNGLHPISNTYPDLHFKRKNTSSKNNEFAIECKYRSSLLDGKFEFNSNQLDNYIKYSKEKGIPVFLALGIGGSPSQPEHIYIVPILESTTKVLDLRKLSNYKLKRKYLFYEPDQESLR